MTRYALRGLGLVLSLVALFAGLFLFDAKNNLSTTGGVALVVVGSLGGIALIGLFLLRDVLLPIRLMAVGLAAGAACLFAIGAFGPLTKPDYIAQANADKKLATQYYSDRVTLRDCKVDEVDGNPEAITVKTDGYACEVTYDREHNAATVIMHDGINLNNTDIDPSDDLRTTTLTFPATGHVDFFLFNKDVTAHLLPRWVQKRGGDGHTFRDGASRYMIALTNS